MFSYTHCKDTSDFRVLKALQSCQRDLSHSWPNRIYVETCPDPTWNLSNVLHRQDSQFFKLNPRKTHTSRHFREWGMVQFEQFFSFLCNNLLEYTERVFFCVNPSKCYPSPKFVYMKASCDARDKLYVWSWHIRCQWYWL